MYLYVRVHVHKRDGNLNLQTGLNFLGGYVVLLQSFPTVKNLMRVALEAFACSATKSWPKKETD